MSDDTINPGDVTDQTAAADAVNTGVEVPINGATENPAEPVRDETVEANASEDDSQDKIQRRIDKLTRKRHEAEEALSEMKAKYESLVAEREKEELKGFENLPVLAETLTREERATLKEATNDSSNLQQQADYWFEHAEDGVVVNGREYSREECMRFGRAQERKAAAASAKANEIIELSRSRLRDHLKKHPFSGKAEVIKNVDDDEDEVPVVKAKVIAKEQPRASAASQIPGQSAPVGTTANVRRIPMTEEEARSAIYGGSDF